MPDDAIRKMLAARDLERRERRLGDTSLWALVNGIHKGDALREWVTLESRPLKPMVVTEGVQGQTVVHVLLTAVPAIDREGPVPAPWGLISWSWPEGRVIQKRDLMTLGGRPTEPLDRGLLASRKDCEAIEEAINTQTPIPVPDDPLAGIYRAVLELTEPRVVAPIMGAVRDLLRECGQESLLGEWRRIASRTHAPRFTVTVAGEFSRGKSRLINTLLGLELLQEGDLPTTAMLARVAHGEPEGLWHVKPDGTRTRLEPGEDTWAELAADDEGDDPQGVLHVVIRDEWLRHTGLQLVDTPGAGDIVGHRAALATEAIASSDATLVTVSATMPLSLTERAFVEQNVLMRATPRVAVVITRLDQIAEGDRERLIENIATRVAEFAPDAEIWCSHGEPVVPVNTSASCSGPEAIRSALAMWAVDPDAAALRNAQIASQLNDLLADCERSLEIRRQAALLKREERHDEFIEATAEVERRQMDWTDLELEVDERASSLATKLREKIFEQENDLLENYAHELDSCGDPVKWWEEQLPFRFRKDLGKRIQVLQGTVEKYVTADVAWLQQQVAERFTSRVQLPGVNSFATADTPDVPDRPDDLGNLQKTNLLATIGFGALSVGTVIIAGPLLALPVAIGGGLARKHIIEAKVQLQRNRIRPVLQQAIRDRLREAADGTRDRIVAMYRRMVEELHRQETAWLKAQHEALRAGADSDEGTEELVEEWLSRARQLQQRIISAGRIER